MKNIGADERAHSSPKAAHDHLGLAPERSARQRCALHTGEHRAIRSDQQTQAVAQQVHGDKEGRFGECERRGDRRRDGGHKLLDTVQQRGEELAGAGGRMKEKKPYQEAASS
jgi:hypothetical protein